MREFVGYMLLYTAIAGIIIVISDLSWCEKLGIFLGTTVFLGLVVSGVYLIAW